MNRKYFLTINNYDDNEWNKALKEISATEYGICCKEVGAQGTPHLHIYTRYKNARSFKSIQKKFPRANIQVGKGRDQDQEYLKKDGNFKEHGTMEQQGKRNDIELIKQVVESGGGMCDIIDVSTSYQSIKCGELLLKYKEAPREIEPIEVIWHYGEAGSGKTKTVFNTEVNIYRPVSYKWWDGYDKHEIVLLDDWRPSWCSFVELLKLTDIYPFKVETKGGSRQVRYKKIYITSHKSPFDYYAHLEETTLKQLTRRITVIKNFNTEVKG